MGPPRLRSCVNLGREQLSDTTKVDASPLCAGVVAAAGLGTAGPVFAARRCRRDGRHAVCVARAGPNRGDGVLRAARHHRALRAGWRNVAWTTAPATRTLVNEARRLNGNYVFISDLHRSVSLRFPDGRAAAACGRSPGLRGGVRAGAEAGPGRTRRTRGSAPPAEERGCAEISGMAERWPGNISRAAPGFRRSRRV